MSHSPYTLLAIYTTRVLREVRGRLVGELPVLVHLGLGQLHVHSVPVLRQFFGNAYALKICAEAKQKGDLERRKRRMLVIKI